MSVFYKKIVGSNIIILDPTSEFNQKEATISAMRPNETSGGGFEYRLKVKDLKSEIWINNDKVKITKYAKLL